MLSQTILKQNAKTSIKAGLAGAGLDAGSQIGAQLTNQIIDNNGYVNFNDINLDYDSIAFSGVAGATTVPSMIQSGKDVFYSIKAINKKWKDFLNSNTINRKNKNFDKIIYHGENIMRHSVFQGANIEFGNSIKNATIDSQYE